MVSFDVKSLFTNVPIYWNIQLVLNYPLGPALVDNFMVELENTIVPVLGECLSFWKLYVEDTVFGKNWDHQLHNNDILNFNPNIIFSKKKKRL